MSRTAMTRPRRATHAALALLTFVVVAIAWGNLDRLAGPWVIALALASLSAVVGLSALVLRHERVAGAALIACALMSPTGFAFLVNLALIVLSIPLVLQPASHRPATGPSAHV